MFSGVRPGLIVPGYSSIGSYVSGNARGEIAEMSAAVSSGCDSAASSSVASSLRTYPEPGGANTPTAGEEGGARRQRWGR